MRTRLLQLLRILSTLLYLSLLALWIRSYAANDSLIWTRSNPTGDWVTQHLRFISEAPPVYVAIEKYTLTSGAGRLRLARIGWNAYDTWSKFPELSSPPLEPQSQFAPLDISRAAGLSCQRAAHLSWTNSVRHDDQFGFFNDTSNWTLVDSGWASPSWNIYVHEVGIPLWLPVLLTFILPILWLRRLWLDRYKRRRGACPTCGYDLCASPVRCPECGTAVHPAPA